MAREQSNKQIARALRLSEATVKTYRLHIYVKFDVADRTEPSPLRWGWGIIRTD